METWHGFPSTRTDDRWPGAWRWGVDFSAEPEHRRVVAVHVGGDGDMKYDLDWIGPIRLTDESAALLEEWARGILEVHGGYVHLFPADGDATAELGEWVRDADASDDARAG
jgi:hypothetical protein